MKTTPSFRWRKVSDAGREYPLFELLKEGVPILDVGFTDDREFEISFDPHIVGQILDGDQFLNLLREGRAIAEDDLTS